VDSLLNQNYGGEFEIILIDDGSSDASGRICDDYATHYLNVRVIHKSNGGQSSARNRGLDVAQGEYIVFLDSDDWVEQDFLAVCSGYLLKNKADILSLGFKVVSPNGDAISSEKKKCKKDILLSMEEFLRTESLGPAPWQEIYRRKFLDQNNLRFLEGVVHEDELFTACAGCFANYIIILDYWGYNYFQSEISTMRNSDSAHLRRRTMDKFSVIKEISKLQLISNLSKIRKTNLNNRIGNMVFGLFRDALKFFPVDLRSDTLSNLRNAGFYPLPEWSSDIRYRFYRRLTLLRFPCSIIRFIYRLFPTTNPIWERIINIRSMIKRGLKS
jgi:glycosyltransferase involved in cell wall biosynthesis